MDDLIEELRAGVTAIGIHDDNSTELFDVDGANQTMTDAADALTTAHAETAALRAEVEKYQRELRIGDRVRVIGKYECDWQGIDTWLVGINMDSEGMNYTIGEQWPVPSRFSIGYSGPTDGFREGQLVRQALKVQP